VCDAGPARAGAPPACPHAATLAPAPTQMRHDKLHSIKAKYDPGNVFHLNVSIPPKA
jgi:hypothetical protein